VINSLPVFYTPKLLADAQSFSPSASKPALVIESWNNLDIPITIHEPAPATVEELCLAHRDTYVSSVLACEGDNGFYNRLQEVAQSLPYTTGAFVAAAREAVQNGLVAVAPVAGFHHAHYGAGGAFCTFNGLVVAAQALKKEGLVDKVGIFDCDYHYGDGTVDIIRHLNLGGWLRQFTAGAIYRRRDQASGFLTHLPDLVGRFKDCDLILYQAGADPHVSDPLGGWLTTEQMAERDRRVFETAHALGIPIAWDLAGGYQEDFRAVLDIHDNTLAACAAVYL